MASLLETLAALATAGTMMISSSLDAAAPQNDVDGFLFLQNRQWLASRAYEPETVTADVPGQIRQMRQEAALALEEMFDACKKDIGITLKAATAAMRGRRRFTITSWSAYTAASKRRMSTLRVPARASIKPGWSWTLGRSRTR